MEQFVDKNASELVCLARQCRIKDDAPLPQERSCVHLAAGAAQPDFRLNANGLTLERREARTQRVDDAAEMACGGRIENEHG